MRLIIASGKEHADDIDGLIEDRFDGVDMAEIDVSDGEPADELNFEGFEKLSKAEQEAETASLEATHASDFSDLYRMGFTYAQVASLSIEEIAAMRKYTPRTKRGKRVKRISPQEKLDLMRERKKNRFKLRQYRKMYERKNKNALETREETRKRRNLPKTVRDDDYHYTYK